MRADEIGAHRRRVAVEHAVDELVAVGAAVGLGELDGLVDHDAVRDVGTTLELPRADREDCALDRRELGGAAVEQRREALDDRVGVLAEAAQAALELANLLEAIDGE